ncbi:MAG: hypothetical protein K5739_01805 [Lachnospiraceae bacterium]|nr:hypothetical protein [Lachnospiraceae bacterium]
MNIKKKMRQFFLLMIICFSAFVPKDAYAQATVQTLSVEEQTLVYDGKVLQSRMEDGEGGSLVYDPIENTLTINHYHFKKAVVKGRFINVCDMSREKPFHIVLNGICTMVRDDDDRIYKNTTNNTEEAYCIDIEACKAIIEGSGKLLANTCLKADELEIRDCDMEISGKFDGIKCNSLVVNNANLMIKVDDGSYFTQAPIWLGLKEDNKVATGELTIMNSCVKTRIKGPYVQPVMIKMDDKYKVGLPFEVENLHFSDDMKITNEQGVPLHVCAVNNTGGYYIFTSDGEEGSFLNYDHMGHDHNYVGSAWFISSAKQKQNETIKKVEDAIASIGSVTIEKESAIKAARLAYNGLEALGEKGAYAKSKVCNYQVLLDAETGLNKLKEEKEKDKKGAEESDQSDQKISVDGKDYTIATPIIKSLKSKKKSIATITYTKEADSDGYQISYSTNKKFKKSKTKTKTIKNSKTKKKTIKALKSGKKYYFRVRIIKIIDGKKYFGNWSKVKKVRIK